MSFSLETPRVENGYKKVMDLEVFYLICGYEISPLFVFPWPKETIKAFPTCCLKPINS